MNHIQITLGILFDSNKHHHALAERREAAIARLKEKGIDPAGRVFVTGEEALQSLPSDRSPFAATITCVDEQHKPVFDLLREKAPNLRAIFSEKPLTETLEQALELKPWLDGLDLVTMNTVIDFSAVFSAFRELQEPGELLDGFKLIGAEGAWLGSYHKYHRALPIGVAGDILHPMNVVVAMLGAGPLKMQSGIGAMGYLNELSPNIIHDISSSHWRGRDTGVNVFLRSCYSGDERQRTVIGYYQSGTKLFAAEFNFDRLDKGFEGADTLDIYEIHPRRKPELIYAYQGGNDDVDMGYAADAQKGKAQAFVGQSLRAYFEPAYRKALTTLDDAIATQTAVSAISFDNPALHLARIPGTDNRQRISDARVNGELEKIFSFGLSLANSSAANIKLRTALHMQVSGHRLGEGSIGILQIKKDLPMSQYSRVKNLLVFVLIFICANLPGAQAGVLSDAPPSPLELQIVPPQMIEGESATYGLKIVNHADHEIVIQRGIEIDTLVNFKWIARMQIQAIADCGAFDFSKSIQAPVRIAASATFNVTPFNGWTCGSQCPTACEKNTPLGPGIYQFVVVTAEGQRQASPSFTLP